MFGAITGAIGIIKKAGPIIGGVKQVVGAVSGSKNEIEALFKSFKRKLDTDGDGKTDFTTKEAIEFVGEVVVVIAKRL